METEDSRLRILTKKFSLTAQLKGEKKGFLRKAREKLHPTVIKSQDIHKLNDLRDSLFSNSFNVSSIPLQRMSVSKPNASFSYLNQSKGDY